ncbi:hypothetical protein C8R46DRAFT_1186232 [Mycena filopes]|nr:hypothetical protein C8R46DRAFT_1186232 [Mycena filopes]
MVVDQAKLFQFRMPEFRRKICLQPPMSGADRTAVSGGSDQIREKTVNLLEKDFLGKSQETSQLSANQCPNPDAKVTLRLEFLVRTEPLSRETLSRWSTCSRKTYWEESRRRVTSFVLCFRRPQAPCTNHRASGPGNLKRGSKRILTLNIPGRIEPPSREPSLNVKVGRALADEDVMILSFTGPFRVMDALTQYKSQLSARETKIDDVLIHCPQPESNGCGYSIARTQVQTMCYWVRGSSRGWTPGLNTDDLCRCSAEMIASHSHANLASLPAACPGTT